MKIIDYIEVVSFILVIATITWISIGALVLIDRIIQQGWN